MFTYAITDEIALELQSPFHAGALFELVDTNREFLSKWINWVKHVHDVTDMRKFMMNDLLGMAEGQRWSWLVRYKSAPAGRIRFHIKGQQAFIGYWLGEEFTGKGIMTRSVSTIIDWCFRKLDIERITIQIEQGNEKSCAVPERLGFSKEAVFREETWRDSRFHHLFVYGLLRSEWQSQSTPIFAYDMGTNAQLRLQQVFDAPRQFARFQENRQHLESWFQWANPAHSLIKERKYTQLQLKKYAESGFIQCGIWEDNDLWGSITLNFAGRWQAGELGYWIDEGKQGRGLVTRAVRALLEYGFSQMKLERISIRAATTNQPSQRVAERIGMQQEVILRKSDPIGTVRHDNVVYSMLKEDFEEK